MCQAYEGERNAVIASEEAADRHGHPRGCSFQAGFYQCPNRYDRYAVTEVWTGTQWGWKCRTCGTFYPRKEPEKRDSK